MAVDALDLDGRTHLAVKLGVAVHVLNEMAVDAVHALFQVNVELMDGQPSRFDSTRSNAARCFAAALLVRYRSLSSAGIDTAAMRAAVELSATGSPRWSRRLPCRSFLKTARKTQP